jgi:hypothetical protein
MINFSSVNKYNGTLRNNFNILINTLKNDDVNKVSLEQLLGFIEDNLNISPSGTETDPIFTASDAASITSSDISNWDDAYSWGDHSLAGYLTSYTESDPLFTSWLATPPDLSEFNNDTGFITSSALSGYLTTVSAAATYQPIGTYATASNSMTFTNKSGDISQWTNDSGFITSSALSSYVPTSRTLTINGSAQDLSTNRSWTVGDVSTSSSYANPSWITSLAFSKVVSLSVASGDTTNNLINTLSDFTGLSASITSGNTYLIIAFGHYDASSTAVGSRWTLNGPALTFISYRSNYSLSATTQTTNHGLSAYQLPAAVNSTSAATTGNTFEIQGIIKPSSSGTLQVQFACETNLGSITAKAGSCLILIPIA